MPFIANSLLSPDKTMDGLVFLAINAETTGVESSANFGFKKTFPRRYTPCMCM